MFRGARLVHVRPKLTGLLRPSLCLTAAALCSFIAGAAELALVSTNGSTTSSHSLKSEPIKPIPLSLDLDLQKAALGRRLFNETKLSGDDSVSCATCHSLSKGGTDRRARSLGINNTEGSINAPTVFNSGFNFKQFWDGRAGTLEEQIHGPVEAPGEMGSSWENVVQKIKEEPDYVSAFLQIFPDGVQQKNIEQAIAEFERSLYTPNSRFDQYLRGNTSALSPDEKEGYRKFKALGCTSCHQGVNIGGNMFERMGAMDDYFVARGNITKADFGRFNVTGKEEDRYVFKVPSLRNVALTAPYFHDGSAPTLEAAVQTMAEYQLGRQLTSTEIREIVSFLKSLTGEYEGRPL
jgi:cytochrome c peroxidase